MLEVVVFAICLVGFQIAAFVLIGLALTSKWFLQRIRWSLYDIFEAFIDFYRVVRERDKLLEDESYPWGSGKNDGES